MKDTINDILAKLYLFAAEEPIKYGVFSAVAGIFIGAFLCSVAGN